MAGHSKFKNIQHRKGAQDKKRAKIFARSDQRNYGGGENGIARP